MGKHMSQAARYWGLTIAMSTYLVPWVWMRDLYRSIGVLFRREAALTAGGRLVLGSETVSGTDKFTMTPDVNTMLAVAAVWGGIAVLITFIRCVNYFCNKRKLLKCAEQCTRLYAAQGVAGVPEELVSRLKQELRIGRRVEVLKIPGINTSLTLGTFRPVVFLQDDCREREMEFALRHEFTHIARGDLIVKFFMGLVCCLHWFNPLVYLLAYLQDRACEKSCDERVVKGRSDEERKIYAELLRRSMALVRKKPKCKMPYGSYLASGRKYAEERVRVIMDKRQRKTWEKVLAAGVFTVMLFVASLTALAYPKIYHVNVSETAAPHVQADSMLVRTAEENNNSESEVFYPVLYEEEVITADGEIHPVNDQTSLSCTHQWEDARYELHSRDGKGGCALKVYECTYCPECQTTNVGNLISTHIHVTCPHDY